MAHTIERAAMDGSAKASKPDAFTPWYTIWCCAFLLWNDVVGYLDDIYNFYILIVFIILPPLLILAVALVVSFAINAFRLRWRKTVSIIAAPIIALSLFGLVHRLGVTPSLVRLELSKSSYIAQIDTLPTTDGPRLKCWDWGSTGGAAVVNIFRTLVYDESDQLSLPRSSWSEAWILKADAACRGTPLQSFIHPRGDSQVGVGRLEGHFYTATEIFQ
jgi:hypothetical protein